MDDSTQPPARTPLTRQQQQEGTDSSTETAVGGPAEVLFSRVDMAKDAILPRLSPPSEEEAKWFYNGLCSQPRLVGRASAGLVPYETLAEQKQAYLDDPRHSTFFSYKKRSATYIGAHPIHAVWDEAVEPMIKLAVSRLPWTSLDVVRLGYADDAHARRPVVVWVGVEHHDIPWPMVAEALRAARLVLDDNQLFDVDVQVRVSQVYPLGLPSPPRRPPLLPVSQEISGAMPTSAWLPFSIAVGNSISPSAQPTPYGTLGVYITPSSAATGSEDSQGTPHPVWAITCRHVALPGADNTRFGPRADGDPAVPPMPFFMPSDKATDDAIDVLGVYCRPQEEGEGASQLSSLRADVYKTALAFKDRDARVSGTIYFSPPIAAAPSPPVWTKDYCLLEMDKAKLPAGSDLTNILDASNTVNGLSYFTALLRAARINYPGFIWPADDMFKIRGLIPLAELRSPRGPFENHFQDACLIVMKKGAASGLTFGCPSEILSTVRNCLPDGGSLETREWAIPGSFQNKNHAFSAPGDSGAAVIGLDGRLGGFLTRGTGNEQGREVDITYASPAVLVFEDIERELGVPVKLL